MEEDEEMGDGINTDRVTVNAGGGDGGGMQAAALVAALGQRNQGGDNAALIAALGGRNQGFVGGDGFGMGGLGGGGLLGGLLIGALLGGGRRGGLLGGGGDDCCHDVSPAQAALLQSLLDSQSDLRAQVPTTALETQNAIQAALSSLALGTQQGFAGVKDSVQGTLLALATSLANVNQNVSEQGCQTRERVDSDGDKTRALLVARFQAEDATKIAEQNARIVALETQCHHDRHHAETTLSITNTNTAVAQQAQMQRIDAEDRRHRDLLAALNVIAVGNQVQLARNVNDTINFGNMAASGIQSTPTTQVR